MSQVKEKITDTNGGKQPLPRYTDQLLKHVTSIHVTSRHFTSLHFTSLLKPNSLKTPDFSRVKDLNSAAAAAGVKGEGGGGERTTGDSARSQTTTLIHMGAHSGVFIFFIDTKSMSKSFLCLVRNNSLENVASFYFFLISRLFRTRYWSSAGGGHVGPAHFALIG